MHKNRKTNDKNGNSYRFNVQCRCVLVLCFLGFMDNR